MVLVLASWFNITFLVLVYGRWVSSLFLPLKAGILPTKYLVPIFIVGVITVTQLVGLIHFFLPVNVLINVVLIVFGLLLVFIFRNKISFPAPTKLKLAKMLIMAGWILFCAALAAGSFKNYDEGLYYQLFIAWTQKFSIVPGLANMYGRLGFNSHWHLFTSIFYFHSDTGIYLNETTSWAITLFGSLCLFAWVAPDEIRNSNKILFCRTLSIIFFCFIPITPFGALSSWTLESFTSCSVDIVVTLGILYVFYSLTQAEHPLEQFVAIVLPFFLLTLKFSSFPMLGALVYLFIFKKYAKHLWFPALGAGMVIAGIYFLRNYILSGYLVYPIHHIDLFSPDWKVPLENLQTESRWILSHARFWPKDSAVVSLEWISKWWSLLADKQKMLLMLVVLSHVLLFLVYLKDQPKALAIWFLALIGQVFWFLTAPDPRFGMGFLLMPLVWAMVELTPTLTRTVAEFEKDFVRSIAPILFVVVMFYALKDTRWTATKTIVPEPFIDYSKAQVKNNHGVDLYYPSHWDQCFDSHLTCTPFLVYAQSFHMDFQKRTERLQDGFKPLGR